MEKLPFWHAVCAAPCTFPAGLKSGAFREVIKVSGRKNTGGECVSLPLPLITCCKVNVLQQPAAYGLSTHQFAGFGSFQGICKEKQKQNHQLWQSPRA